MGDEDSCARMKRKAMIISGVSDPLFDSLPSINKCFMFLQIAHKKLNF